jgi:alpha-tubulin suppressor-like RCC1 family protein
MGGRQIAAPPLGQVGSRPQRANLVKPMSCSRAYRIRVLIVLGLFLSACRDVTSPTVAPFATAVVASGVVHTCALLHPGALVCWGADLASGGAPTQVLGNALPRVLAAPALTSISAGGTHSCGLTNVGEAFCWGTNEKGQLGDGTVTNRALPVPVNSTLRFLSIAAGGGFTCGITTQHLAYCWGDGSAGQLGDGVDTSNHTSSAPVRVLGNRQFVAIAAIAHACALDDGGRAFCWGVRTGGLSAATAARTRSELSSSAVPSCDSVYDSRDTHCAIPTAVPGGQIFQRITSGTYVDCAVDGAGAAWCWGDNTYGTLGNGANGLFFASAPVQVQIARPVVLITAGTTHACATVSDSTSYCWGLNMGGELGDGSFGGVAPLPVQVAGGNKFAALSAGGFHTCGITASLQVFCWGSNGSGELGQSSSFSQGDVPVVVSIP